MWIDDPTAWSVTVPFKINDGGELTMGEQFIESTGDLIFDR